MNTLTAKKLLKIRKSKNLIEDIQACGINSYMTLIDMVSSSHNINVDDLKKIFDYDKEGIHLERYRFNKFNTLLKDKQIPYKAYMKPFEGHIELLKQLDKLPVPVFFWMNVLDVVKDQFKYSQKTINFGDERALFRSNNLHLMLLVGYEESGQELLFIDPVYQLPYYDEKDLMDKKKLCRMSSKQFYECAKNLKMYVQFKYMEKLAKNYKKSNANKDKSKEEQRLLQ